MLASSARCPHVHLISATVPVPYSRYRTHPLSSRPHPFPIPAMSRTHPLSPLYTAPVPHPRFCCRPLLPLSHPFPIAYPLSPLRTVLTTCSRCRTRPISPPPPLSPIPVGVPIPDSRYRTCPLSPLHGLIPVPANPSRPLSARRCPYPCCDGATTMTVPGCCLLLLGVGRSLHTVL